ncbi:hypothetical protein BBJ28_00023341 [Nothophytophthora sp. Chile5]|nr:hypothetical protein BBJ28_00023341 [Nothophytophthora sp. Chile5]
MGLMMRSSDCQNEEQCGTPQLPPADEIAAAERAVEDVVVEFARLEEVRDAVAKLKHGKTEAAGTNASLTAEVESTVGLHQELEAALAAMAEVFSAVEDVSKRNDPFDATRSSAGQAVAKKLDGNGTGDDIRQGFCNLVGNTNQLSFDRRSERIEMVLLAFKRAFVKYSDGRQLMKVLQAMGKVAHWMLKDPRQSQLLQFYRCMIEEVNAYVDRLPHSSGNTSLRGMSDILAGEPGTAAQEFIQLIQEKVAQMNEWLDRTAPLGDLKKMITFMAEVGHQVVVGWEPRKDPAFCEGVGR